MTTKLWIEDKLYFVDEEVTCQFAIMTSEISELKEMLDIAWEAINEAGYQGFSNKLRDYMEQDSKCDEILSEEEFHHNNEI